jgi:hypothetical protein
MPITAKIQCVVPDSRFPLILAGNLFVVVDDGLAVAADYPILGLVVVREARAYPTGVACVCIIPPNARPPREEIRDAIRATFANVQKHFASVCWYVEGDGFKAAAARAVLSGLILLMRPSYPTHITSDLHDALKWSYARVGNPDQYDLTAIARQLVELRRSFDRKLDRPA